MIIALHMTVASIAYIFSFYQWTISTQKGLLNISAASSLTSNLMKIEEILRVCSKFVCLFVFFLITLSGDSISKHYNILILNNS